MRVHWALAAVVLAAWWAMSEIASPQAIEQPDGRVAALIEIRGAIGPATARFVKGGIETAAQRRAEVLLMRLNTPGGLASSMREIIADILASPVPVVGYVAPAGAHAASAGTYILYATHVAAMAPGTNLGAATPVQIGGLPGINPDRGSGDKESEAGKDGKDRAQPKDAMTAKATNDAVALIRSLAELRRRNANWAEEAVREAASLSAGAALENNVIDLMARTPEELLAQIDGREVDVAGGRRRLATKGLALETIEPRWLDRLLGVVTDPNVAFILMIVGLYGLILEFSNPGAVAPGVIGAIALVLGLYALNTLPIDYTGLALMLLGIAFLVAEAFTPTIVLGVGGLVAFLLGAAMLIDTDLPEFRLSWTVIGSMAMASLALFTLALGYLIRVRHRPVRTGGEAMIGSPVEVLDWSGDAGHVLLHGERWQARGAPGLMRGERVRVAAIDGLTLEVRRPQLRPTGQGEER